MTPEPSGPLGTVGVQHVSVNVDDLDVALTFYVEALGLTPAERPDLGFPGAWLQGPNGVQVHLLEREGGGSDANHFALEVRDLDAAVASLRGRGLDVNDPFDVGAGRQVFLRDPSGNVVELNQPTR